MGGRGGSGPAGGGGVGQVQPGKGGVGQVQPGGRGGSGPAGGRGGSGPAGGEGWVRSSRGGGVGQVQRGGGGSAKIAQHRKYLLHGGRYASCVHAGGLSCCLYFLFSFFSGQQHER